MISSAADSLAELRLRQIGSNLYFCLKGPEPLIRAIAIALTRLLAAGPRLEKRVSLYLALLTQSGESGRCQVYQEQLAAVAGVSTRHLHRLLADLETIGLVQIRRQPRPQPNDYYLPLRAALRESAGLTLADSPLSVKEEPAEQRGESFMIHEHDDSRGNQSKQHLLFLHQGQRQKRLAQPHCTPAFLQAWDDWWAAGRFGRLRNPAGWANLQIKQAYWPPQAPTPLPLLAAPVEPPLEAYQPAAPTAEDVLWGEILAQLRPQLTKATFETWLKETHLASREGNRFTLAVPSGFARDWLEHRLQPIIKRAITLVTDTPPEQIELLFRVGAN